MKWAHVSYSGYFCLVPCWLLASVLYQVEMRVSPGFFILMSLRAMPVLICCLFPYNLQLLQYASGQVVRWEQPGLLFMC